MQTCPNCDRVYDESEYSRCPYCSGEIELVSEERYFKNCPNCGETIDSDEDDNDGIIEGIF